MRFVKDLKNCHLIEDRRRGGGFRLTNLSYYYTRGASWTRRRTTGDDVLIESIILCLIWFVSIILYVEPCINVENFCRILRQSEPCVFRTDLKVNLQRKFELVQTFLAISEPFFPSYSGHESRNKTFGVYTEYKNLHVYEYFFKQLYLFWNNYAIHFVTRWQKWFCEIFWK